MLSNHLKTSFRHLIRNKLAASLNITGLAIALAAAFMILRYLDFQLSYDSYLPGSDNIYRVSTLGEEGGQHPRSAKTYFGLTDWLRASAPGVTAATRFYRWPANAGILFEVNGRIIEEKRYLFADDAFFHVFPLLIEGDPRTCLAQPDAVVLSARLAMKLFGTRDVIGRTLQDPERRGKLLKVTGVMLHTPANSSMDADVVRPYEWIADRGDEWKVMTWTYVRLSAETDVPALTAMIDQQLRSVLPKESNAGVSLQPVRDIHLGGPFDGEAKAGTRLLNIYVMIASLIIIIAVAWINYINLETARLMRRMKEVAIRRIVGSRRRDILARMLMEFVWVNIAAGMLAIAILTIAASPIANITGIPVEHMQFLVPDLWIVSFTAFFIGSLIVATVPFIFVFRIRPALSLKGDVIPNTRSSVVRKSLLGFQFATSLVLMALVTTVMAQLEFMRKSDSQLDFNSVVTIHNQGNYTYREDSLRQFTNEAFRSQLMLIPGVENLSTSSAIPGEAIGFTYTDLAKRDRGDTDRKVPYKVMYVDYDFIPLFQLTMVAGRNYSPEYSDRNCLVITESTARELDYESAEAAVNEKIWFMEDDWDQWTIIGVVKDYRHQSVKTPVYPTIFRLHRNRGQMVYYSVRMAEGSHPSDIVPKIETLWNQIWPEKEFDYFFIDQHYDSQFKSEIQFSDVCTLFSSIALVVACLGVMGMSLLEANMRVKEISIRKVLGATLPAIVRLLTRDSFRVLAISFLIAAPLAWLLAKGWLRDYAVRIEISPWFIALPLVVVAIFVAVIAGGQAARAALKNPVDHLRQE
jgi:putative ABC transport system permease protein